MSAVSGVSGAAVSGAVSVEEARRAARALRDGLPGRRLSVTVVTEARIQLAAIETAMRRPEPDRSRVARYLGRFTQLMTAAGSLPGALTGPLRTLADWLGPMGEPLLAMLG